MVAFLFQKLKVLVKSLWFIGDVFYGMNYQVQYFDNFKSTVKSHFLDLN